MSRKKKNQLSPANLEIMKIVWDREKVTIGEVFEAINDGRATPVRRTTVQVQMNRLIEYGWLERRKSGRSFVYSTAAGRQKTRKEILEDINKRVFGGSRAEMVRCLLEDGQVSDEELKALRNLIHSLEEKEP
ncbi:MAG: BlaI/MecI/CopY family transcriptional regulator [Acidobacteria bacterium]|nr:BlaI/MecI/CopY family transcriptional regulator [Acidobacteriota bacterium]MBU4255227.1 BlaI/MecI/CopY family transcriptional regulator [Acidobacteriota bacterium]MBU4330589.1 BlaI/MecI/CopY family transcriptional regulator [Acidobacteriota bacterium]MCG2815640.1 BlaI/MecI/CopY family transcriptional regulator [Candidatus Aminicenantes bacterium]